MGFGEVTLGDQQLYQPFGGLEGVRAFVHSGAELGHRAAVGEHVGQDYLS
jgi:hypothetical protein